jgi:hypothetical protein
MTNTDNTDYGIYRSVTGTAKTCYLVMLTDTQLSKKFL